jgi:hypothetical protein
MRKLTLFMITIMLILITLTVSWLQIHFITPLLKRPMVIENCTILYNCAPKDGILGRTYCSCSYKQIKCKGRWFTNYCILENSD